MDEGTALFEAYNAAAAARAGIAAIDGVRLLGERPEDLAGMSEVDPFRLTCDLRSIGMSGTQQNGTAVSSATSSLRITCPCPYLHLFRDCAAVKWGLSHAFLSVRLPRNVFPFLCLVPVLFRTSPCNGWAANYPRLSKHPGGEACHLLEEQFSVVAELSTPQVNAPLTTLSRPP